VPIDVLSYVLRVVRLDGALLFMGNKEDFAAAMLGLTAAFA
jgi:hypothetical protein